jgi:hypothetical protein
MAVNVVHVATPSPQPNQVISIKLVILRIEENPQPTGTAEYVAICDTSELLGIRKAGESSPRVYQVEL